MRNMSIISRNLNYPYKAADLTRVPVDGNLESKPRNRSLQDLYPESEMANGLNRPAPPPLGAISNLKSHLPPFGHWEACND